MPWIRFDVCVLLSLVLSTSAPLPAHACDATFPAETVVFSDAATGYGSEVAATVCAGAALSFFGSDGRIAVGSGGSATVAGSDNRLFVESGGSVVLTGIDNVAFVVDGAAAHDASGENEIRRCERLDLDFIRPPGPACGVTSRSAGSGAPATHVGLVQAATALEDLGDAGQRLADGVLPRPSPDPERPLVGNWRVAAGWFDEQTIETDGRIVLYGSGFGVQNYRLPIAGRWLPQISSFRWRADPRQVTIDESLRWLRLEASPNRQRVALDLDGGHRVVLELVRD